MSLGSPSIPRSLGLSVNSSGNISPNFEPKQVRVVPCVDELQQELFLDDMVLKVLHQIANLALSIEFLLAECRDGLKVSKTISVDQKLVFFIFKFAHLIINLIIFEI